MQKRYVLIGASGRALYMYAQPIVNTFSHCAKVVGIYDINILRCQEVVKQAGLDCPIYEDIDRMLAETKPDAAIITTVDRFHHEYAIKCMEAGIEAGRKAVPAIRKAIAAWVAARAKPVAAP